MKRTIAILALIGVACGGEDEAPAEPVLRAVRYVVVAEDDGARQRSFSGAVRAGSQSRLSFQVAGRITEFPVKVGDGVRRGQRIAALDPTDYQIQLQEARASAAQARAQSRSAAATYDRIRALYENRNASRQDLDNARANRDGAQAASAAASQAVRGLQRQLEYATLTAPDDGTISEVSAEANEVVAAGQVVAVLQVGEQLEVAVDVPESHINRISRGDEVEVAVDSQPSITGEVYEVGVPMAGTAVFPVTIRLPEGLEGVRQGNTATVTFQFEVEDSAAKHILPVTAVGEDREGRFVFIVEGEGDTGTLRRVGVEVGDIGAEGLEIVDGVENGQRVVTAGVSRVRDGLEVRVPPLEGEEEEAPASEEEPEGDEEAEG
ncbi:MAG: efflux RND transporter periplasmic adaptor subunit [Myxococcota bacterium]